MDWLFQSLLSRFIWELLLLMGGAGILAYLRAKWPGIAASVMYGLAALTCMSIILFTVTGQALLSSAQPETTVGNVQQHLRSWLDDLGLGVTQIANNDATMFFAYEVTLPNNTIVAVARPKDRDRFIWFKTKIGFEALKTNLDKMDESQKITALEEVNLELAKGGVHYVMPPSAPLSEITVVKKIPITSALTRDTFVDKLDEMDSNVQLAKEAVVLAMKKDRRPCGPVH